nr:SprB repeat-containing protein [Bacteroidota bacterium]
MHTTLSQAITQPNALALTIGTVTNVNCNGNSNGAININIAGGTTPYTYAWSNGATTQNITNLSPNTYTITVTDANGCTATLSQAITQPNAVSLAIGTVTNVNCNGNNNGAININIAGGTTPYSYAWSNGATTQNVTNLSPNTYTVTVTDANGCTATLSQTITQPNALALTIGTVTNVNCNGNNNGAININVAGGTTPFTYAWSNGATTQNVTNLSPNTYTVTVTDANGCTATLSQSIIQPNVLALTIGTVTNVNCNGSNNGAININVAGGTTPYTYAWSNGATTQNVTNLAPNTYTVTVTDANGCTATLSQAITQPNALALTIGAVTNVNCNGNNNGAININIAGGTTPYTYAWSNGVTTQNVANLAPNTYTVTVTDVNGCTATLSQSITQPNSLALTIGTVTNVNCNGSNNGAININVAGGTTPYTYAWSNGVTTQNVTNLAPNTYTVTVTDVNGCTATLSQSITQPNSLALTIGTVTNVNCNGSNNGAININVAGGTTPYAYSWSNGATTQNVTNLAPNTYTVTVTDANGCTATLSQSITQPNALSLAIGTVTNVNCNGNNNGAININIVGGTTPYTYTWSNGATTQNITNLAPNTYTVTVTDANGCTATLSQTITQPNALALTIGTVTNVNCNGNNNGAININIAGGTTPYAYSWSNGATTQNVNNLSPNTYTVTVTDANGCTTTLSQAITQPNALALTIGTVTNVNCNGNNNGVININIAGGTTPYTYAWSNGATTQNITNLAPNTYTVTVTDANGCTTTLSQTITQPNALALTIGTLTNVNCNGNNNGAININVAGGTTPYTYAWSNGATTQNVANLAPNTYTATVTDANGCTATLSQSITQPNALTLTIGTVTNVNCNGNNNGAISINIAGGTTPYTYAWSNGATTQNISNLSPNTYTITVTDANGCTATLSQVITQPNSLALTIGTVTNVNCNGNSNGAININIAGGTTPFTYAWSNGATTQNVTNLSPNTYTVTVTDANGCTATLSQVITQPNSLALTIGTVTNVSCNGNSNGAININVAGGTTPYIYTWSNGATTQNITNLAPNTYTVTVTDANGCTATISQSITQPNALALTIGTVTNVNCNGSNNGTININIAGGIAPYTYIWSNGATTQNITNLAPNTYTVTVTDANGCTTTLSQAITQPIALSLAIGTVTNVNCNGNSNGAININIAGGTTPYAYAWSNGATTQNVNNLSPNTYTVTVTDANGCTTTLSQAITQPNAVSLAIGTVTNVNCNGNNNGAININIAGGTTPYSYAWSNGATTQNVTNLSPNTYTVTVTDANGCTATLSQSITQPNSLALTIGTVTNVNCNGNNNGTININIAGGTTPYTYAWSNGATTQNLTNLSPNTYTITVTDANGCTATLSQVITQPNALALTIGTVTNVNCNGNSNGAISINIAGGTTPYTYAWSNGATTQNITNLAPNTYTLTVTDANGCTTTLSQSITQPNSLTLTIGTVTNVNCNGNNNGAISINIAGGTTPYTYAWSNGVTTQNVANLAPNTYTVTVTDANGCTTTLSQAITQPNALALTIGTVTNVNCNGNNNGAININIVGGTTPYTYAWSNGATTQNVNNLSPNTYTVTVTDANGCTTTLSQTITQPNALSLAIGTVTNVNCNGNSNGAININIVGGIAPYTYIWSNGATTQNVNNLSPNTYTVTVTDANGCTTTLSQAITQPIAWLGQMTKGGPREATRHPLHTHHLALTIGTVTNVNCNGSNNGAISINIAGGTTPYTYTWSNGATTQNISNLSPNTYTITVTDANGCTATLSQAITQPNALALTIGTVTNVNCNGNNNGAININIAGGSTPYTYTWSNGATTQNITNLAPNTYTVTVTDANGCTTTLSQTITQPNAVSLAIGTVTNVYCNGNNNGVININIAGGTTPYSYAWSNGTTTQNVTNLSPNTYTVTVTDANGCTATLSQAITQPNSLALTIGTVTNVNCNGNNNGAVNINIAGGTTPYIYTWSNGATTQNITNLAPNTYTVTVTDANGCTATLSQSITQPNSLALTIGTVTNVNCNGNNNGAISINIAGGTTPYTYAWSNGATTQNVANLSPNTYTVTVTDSVDVLQHYHS